jgi:hypothetical protein
MLSSIYLEHQWKMENLIRVSLGRRRPLYRWLARDVTGVSFFVSFHGLTPAGAGRRKTVGQATILAIRWGRTPAGISETAEIETFLLRLQSTTH